MQDLGAWVNGQRPVRFYGRIGPNSVLIITFKHMVGKNLTKGQLVEIDFVNAAMCSGLDINHVLIGI